MVVLVLNRKMMAPQSTGLLVRGLRIKVVQLSSLVTLRGLRGSESLLYERWYLFARIISLEKKMAFPWTCPSRVNN